MLLAGANLMTLILTNDDVEKLLPMHECIEALEDVYVELSAGRAVNRIRSDSLVPTTGNGAIYSLKSMDAVIPKLGVGAVRIDSDIVTWPKRGGNRRRVKVPSAPNSRYVGLILLFSSETSEPLAILPDGVLQRIRVGATNGLGIKYLARKDATSVGILGSGWQAGTQLMAVFAVRENWGDPVFQPESRPLRRLRARDELRTAHRGPCGRSARRGHRLGRHRDVCHQFD
jgi:alanine dehydrogenase